MKHALIIAMAIFMAGCVSPSTILVNEKGHRVSCEATGFGLISGTMANNTHSTCVAQAQMAGYTIETQR